MERIREALPKLKLKQHLTSFGLLEDVDSELNITQFSNGYSNLTYLLESEGKSFVLRCPPKGAIKRGHDMGREYKVLSALSKAYTIAPKPYLFTEDASIIGSAFYIMEKIEGIILTTKEAHKRNVSSQEFSIISNTWLHQCVALHKVDYESVGLGDLGRPLGYVERQVSNWSKQYTKAATMDIPEANQLMVWMNENQPKEYNHSFIHNDYKYDNVVFEDDTWKTISSILDWEMCTIGDPLMDLGTSLAYWIMETDNSAMHILNSPTSMAGNPSRSEIVQKYAELSGKKVDNIVFYYAFGLFKIAVIVQQIFYRYKAGLTKDPKFAHLDKACDMFCKMGWQAVQKNRIENYM